MFGPDKRYLIVSINEGVIKLAQSSASGSLERIARGTFAINSSEDEAAKVLKSLLGSFNCKVPVFCVIPSSVVTAKNIEVPSVDPEEIKSIVHLQASRHTPYSRQEVLISYINLGTDASNNTRILLVIVQRNTVQDRISILEKSGLDADKILFVPEAQARFYAKALNLKNEDPFLGIIDFSLNAANFIVISKGSLLFVRHIPIGIKAIVEGTDTVVKLQDELKKSINAFMQENGSQAPASYMLTTSHEALNNILPVLKENLKINLKVNAFLNFIECSMEVRKKLQDDFGDDSFLDVIAPAATAMKCEVNLMPEEVALRKTVEHQSREAAKSGAYVIITMLLVGAMILCNIAFKETFLNKNLREHFATQKAQVKVLEEKMNKARLVRDYIKNRMASLDIIEQLYAMTPHSIYFNTVTMDEDGSVAVSGISDSMALVYSYVKALGDSTVFSEVKLKSTSTRKENGEDVAAFDIEFKYNGLEAVTTKEQV